MAECSGEKLDINSYSENYLRLHLLEVKAGTTVLRNLFLKIVRNSPAKGDVDKYLGYFKCEIQYHKHGTEELKILFPNSGLTDINKWDVSLLAYVLLHCCTLEGQLSLKRKKNLREILKRQIKTHGDLPQFLSDNQKIIKGLKCRITQQQYETLYPQNHQPVKIEDWDVELVLQVLLKVCNDADSLQKVRSVCIDVLKRQVEIFSTNIVLDELLKHHQNKFDQLKEEKKLTDNEYKQIFPGNSPPDANNWNDGVLICVVVNTCQALSQLACKGVKTIRQMRKDLGAHTAETKINNVDFLEKWTDLLGAIIGVTATETSESLPAVTEMVDSIKGGPLDIQNSITYLREWYFNQETKYGAILKKLSAIELNATSTTTVVLQKINENSKKLDELLRRWPEPGYSHTRSTEELKVAITVNGENEDAVNNAETSIHTAFNGIEDENTESLLPHTDKIKQMQSNDGNEIKRVEKGSIILVVKCSSLRGVHNLLKTLKSSDLRKCLGQLEDVLTKINKCPIRLSIHLTNSSLLKIMEMVVKFAPQSEKTSSPDEQNTLQTVLEVSSDLKKHQEDTNEAGSAPGVPQSSEIKQWSGDDETREETSSPDEQNTLQTVLEVSSDLKKHQQDTNEAPSVPGVQQALEAQPWPGDDNYRDIKNTMEKITIPQTEKDEKTNVQIQNRMDMVQTKFEVSGGSTDNLCLPNKAKFNEMCKELRYKNTKLFKQNCENICNHIKANSNKYVSVHTAYKANNVNEVVFITYTIEDTLPSAISEYTTIHSHMNKCSKEGRDVAEHGKDTFLSREDSSKLRKCLQKHSTRLMAEHSNLTMTSACLFKSKDYGTDKWVKVKMPCIVLYVMFKGYIPISEEPLPTELDGITVDVRDGLFSFCGPCEYQQKLKQGSRISGEVNAGTLSTFIDLNNETCCLTSAHALLGESDMKTLTNGSIQRRIALHGCNIYQPERQLDNYTIGHVKEAIYSPGNGDRAGFEIAVVRITSRFPECGRFPVEGMGSKEIMDDISRLRFTSGKICTPSQCTPGAEVIMFGSETGLNKGKVKFFGTSLVTRNIDLDVLNCKFVLNQQILVEPNNPNTTDIAKIGDSGALVFVPILGNFSDLRALGIFEGNTSDGYYIVTPIWDIMEALGHPKLMAFIDHTLASITDSADQLKQEFNQRFDELERNVKLIMQHLKIKQSQ